MKAERYKWWLLALLGGAYFFHQADRAIFGVLTAYISSDLGLVKPEIGRINTVMSWTIAIVTFVAGFLGDRFSRKWIITFSLMFWSVATAALGFAGDWHVLGCAIPAYATVMALRAFATGGGESFYGPSAMSLIASYHERTLSLAFSINQAFLYLGLMFSGCLAFEAFRLFGGWRAVFIVFGAAGFLLGASFLFLLKDPRDGAKTARTATDATPRSPLAVLRTFFGTPSAVLATAGFIAIVSVNNAYLFWAPTLFAEKYGVEPVEAGAHAMFYHHLVAFAAILFGGWLTDRWVVRFPRFRLALQTLALFGGAVALYAIGERGGFAAAVAMTAVYGLFRGLFEVNTHASVFDVLPVDCRASAVGIMLLLAFFLGGWFAGDFLGWVLARTPGDGCSRVFTILSLVYLAGAAALAVSFVFTFRRDRRKLGKGFSS